MPRPTGGMAGRAKILDTPSSCSEFEGGTVAENRDWDWAGRQVQDLGGDVDVWMDAVEVLDRLATPERLGDLEVMLRHEVFCVREAAATPYARLLGAASLPL